MNTTSHSRSPLRMTTAMVLLVLLRLLAPARAQEVTPAHRYMFNNSYADDMGGSSATSGGGTAVTGGVYNFSFGNGPSVSNGLASAGDYTIEMLVRLTDVSGYKALVNFDNLAGERTVFVRDGQIIFYALSVGTVSGTTDMVNNQWHRIVLTRDSATNILTCYVDGRRVLGAVDGAGAYNANGNAARILHFCRDNGTEHSGGDIDLIRLHNRALTEKEISSPARHIFEFNDSYADSVTGSVWMTPAGGTRGATAYTYGIGEGPNVYPSLTNTAEYSLEMAFTPNSLDGYVSLVNFSDRALDAGIYLWNGQAYFAPSGPAAGTALAANQRNRVIVTRNAVTKEAKFYLNGVLASTRTDSANNFVMSAANILHFMRDDGTEHAAGSLDQVRIYNDVLTPGQVAQRGGGGGPEIEVAYNAVPIPDNSSNPQNFGSVAAGNSVLRTFTVRNAGIADMTGMAITKSGAHPGDFNISFSWPSTGGGGILDPAPSSADQLSLSVTFSPTATGTRSAVILIASNDADENPFEINVTGTGLAAPPTVTGISPNSGPSTGGTVVTISGTGFTGATGVTIGGAAATALNVTSATSLTCTTPAGTVGARSVVVTTPGGSNAANALFTYTVPEIEVFMGPVTGTALADNSGTQSFGSASTGSSIPQLFTIRNTGTGPLTGLALTKGGPHAAEFTTGSLGQTTLNPNETTTFTVTFSPAGAGQRTAVVNLASNDPDENPFEIHLTGTGTISSISATYTSATDVPLTLASVALTGGTATLALGYAPAPGTELTVVKNTGIAFISGTFSNLTQGQTVSLLYGGNTYDFVVNYYGGTGNDLVLVWKYNRALMWGPGTTSVPVAVPATGILAGKTVIACAPGGVFRLVLCSDGTLAAWGTNDHGQLGNNTYTSSNVPVAVNTAGVLAGKTVVAVAAGDYHSMALCSDGTVATWGSDETGQLGSNSPAGGTAVPVAVNTASGVSALYGKSVVAIAAASLHSLALCSDGTVAAWGWNSRGLLGNNSTANSNVPVAVNTTSGVSALFGKTVVAIAAGPAHNAALCSDGTLAAWGENSYGQLGDNSYTSRRVPVRVNAASGTSALFGKTVVSIGGGNSHSLALCSDSTVVAWGWNYYGQLGINSTATSESIVPVAVNAAGGTSALFGKTVVTAAAGYGYNVALCSDGTVAAWGSNDAGQIGDGTTTQRNAPVAVNFPGLPASARITRIAAAGHTLAVAGMSPEQDIAVFNGSSTTGPSRTDNAGTADLGTLPLGGSYTEQTFTIQNAGGKLPLTGLTLSVSGAHPGDFTVTQPALTTLAPYGTAAFTVKFLPVAAGARTAVVNIASNDPDENPFRIRVSGTATTAALNVTLNNPLTIPLTVTGFRADTLSLNITLAHQPVVGAPLTVVNVAGPAPIAGTFPGLPQGAEYVLSFGGQRYRYVANYYGGSGNDFTLVWAENHLAAWGAGAGNRLGTGSTANQPAPVLVSSPLLAGKTILDGSAGGDHSLVLCSDGTLLGWGSGGMVNSAVPVVLSNTGALAGRRIARVSSGSSHAVALCTDGALVAWGDNQMGQLGAGDQLPHAVPVLVDTTTALAGKTVTAISCGGMASLALCSDGSLAYWGRQKADNSGGASGINHLSPILIPVTGTALAGRTPVAISCGTDHSLALCSDNTLVAWGRNQGRQLGTLESNGSWLAVAVQMDYPGVLAGRTIQSISAGTRGSLALCTDGTIAAWGRYPGNILVISNWPDRVSASVPSALAGKSPRAAVNMNDHSAVLTTDGSLATWGVNDSGTLGDGTTTSRDIPVSVLNTVLAAGEKFSDIFPGADGLHHLAVIAEPFPSVARAGLDNALAAAGLTGANAGADAEPFGDGVPNLLKFAFNMNTGGPDSGTLAPGGNSGLPVFSIVAGPPAKFRVEYVRRKNSGLLYTPRRGSSASESTPMTGTPVITSIDANFERVVIEEPLGTPAPASGFSSVSVTVP